MHAKYEVSTFNCSKVMANVTVDNRQTDRQIARRGGAEVAGWTLDRKIRVRSPLTLTACGPSNGKEVKDVFGRPGARVEVGYTLKTPSCPWRGCPAAGQNLETGHLSRLYIAKISLNVTLNHNQQQQQRQTNKQTGQKQYAPDHSIRGHKNIISLFLSR